MIKTFNEFTEAEKKIICEKNKEYMLYPDWFYDVAYDMPELEPLGDFVLDGAEDNKLKFIEVVNEVDNISELEQKLNKAVDEYFAFLTSPEHVAEGLAENNEIIDTETYEVVA